MVNYLVEIAIFSVCSTLTFKVAVSVYGTSDYLIVQTPSDRAWILR